MLIRNPKTRKTSTEDFAPLLHSSSQAKFGKKMLSYHKKFKTTNDIPGDSKSWESPDEVDIA